MSKTIYYIVSLRNETPTYRVYNYDYALKLIAKVRLEWPEASFWLEKRETKDD